jgi:signal transduction histidine kinase
VRAEFTVPPEEAPPAPEAPPHAGQVDLLEQVAEEQRREERDRIARELGLEPDES